LKFEDFTQKSQMNERKAQVNVDSESHLNHHHHHHHHYWCLREKYSQEKLDPTKYAFNTHTLRFIKEICE